MIKITKEIKKLLKDYYIEIISEAPLSIKDGFNNVSKGLPAEIIINQIIEENSDDETLDLIDIKTIDVDKNYLLTFEGNYADEFDLSEFMTMKGDDIIALIEVLKSYDDEIEISFGTNEELTFDDGDDLLAHISLKEITETESNVLDKLFSCGFGNAGVFDYISEIGSEIDEDVSEISSEIDEDEDNNYHQKEIKNIKEKLSNFGWEMINIKDNYYFKYSNSNNEVGFGNLDLGKKILYSLK